MVSPLAVAGVLGASLIGSVHCAGMCGPFACLYGGDAGARQAPPLQGHLAYHGGRLAAYATLGAAAGALGAGVEHMGAWAGLAHAAGILAGVLLVLWGLALLASTRGGSLIPSPVRKAVPEQVTRVIGAALLRLKAQPLGVRAGALGLLTGLIPCGWLYAFVVTAAGTGTPWAGALVMVAFWLGTVPALVAVATGMRYATGALARHLPTASALLVIGVGIAGLAGRLGMPATAHAGHDAAGSHAPAMTPASTPAGDDGEAAAPAGAPIPADSMPAGAMSHGH